MADPKSNRKSPAFQFYPSDFLNDEHVKLMSLQERGAYITLMCQCWIEGSLPADITLLARLCGAQIAGFRKFWAAIAPCFRSKDADRLIHPRLEKERQNQREYRRRQADNGAKRWDSQRYATALPRHSDGNATAQPPPIQRQASGNALISSLSQTQSQSRTPEVPSAADARSKRPIFKGSRFVVFEWQLDDLRRLLGSSFEAFDVHAWFFELDTRALDENLVVPQRDGGQWLQAQTVEEAQRRGVLTVESDSKLTKALKRASEAWQ